jgi:CRISPR-associated protein Cas6/Cse3/CasE subtype I-E
MAIIGRKQLQDFSSKDGENNKSRKIDLVLAEFEGYLRVDDPALFIQTLSKGIGRGKGFGLGMLLIGR